MSKRIKNLFARQKGTVATLCIVCALFFMVSGCGKSFFEGDGEEPKTLQGKIVEGKYSGTFTVKYFVDMPTSWDAGSGKVTLELKKGKFSCTANPNRVPAGGSGSYSIRNGKIIFEEAHFWTADFDWGLILSGEYKYTVNGKKLKISKKFDHAHYEYDLKKE